MNLHPALAIGIPLLTAALAGYISHQKGRNIWLGVVIGFVFGLLGAIVLYFLPEKKKEEAVSLPKDPVFTHAPLGSQKLWYYLDQENKQCGPISTNKLQEELKFGRLEKSTYVWNEEMDDWRKISEVPGDLTPISD